MLTQNMIIKIEYQDIEWDCKIEGLKLIPLKAKAINLEKKDLKLSDNYQQVNIKTDTGVMVTQFYNMNRQYENILHIDMKDVSRLVKGLIDSIQYIQRCGPNAKWLKESKK